MTKKNFPDPETIVPQKNYSFTINLADMNNHRYKIQYDSPMIELYNRYKTIFTKLSQTVRIKMYAEFSKQGRLHYHGYIKFPTRHTVLPTLLFLKDVDAAIEIAALNETIDIQYQWDLYIKKQRHLMKHYMTTLGLQYRFITR